jgi:hypothetical protein
MPAFAGMVQMHPDNARKQEMGRDQGDENWEEGKTQEEKRINACPTTHPSTLQHY